MTVTAEDFTRYVRARQLPLTRIAALITGDWHSGEDAVQTALTRVYRSRLRIRDDGALEAYVRRAVTNAAISVRRSARVHEPETDVVDHAAGDPVVEVRSELWPLLRALPDRQRAALVLRYYADLTDVQVAEAMGVSVGSAKQHLHRGLAALRAAHPSYEGDRA